MILTLQKIFEMKHKLKRDTVEYSFPVEYLGWLEPPLKSFLNISKVKQVIKPPTLHIYEQKSKLQKELFNTKDTYFSIKVCFLYFQ